MLVERVEGFATEAEYMRAYGEINHFEEQLVNDGILLLKFWIHISKAEQLRRFKDRSGTSYKRWKITDEDWRNRKRWEDYTVAVNDMVERTARRSRRGRSLKAMTRTSHGSRCSGRSLRGSRPPEEVTHRVM